MAVREVRWDGMKHNDCLIVLELTCSRHKFWGTSAHL